MILTLFFCCLFVCFCFLLVARDITVNSAHENYKGTELFDKTILLVVCSFSIDRLHLTIISFIFLHLPWFNIPLCSLHLTLCQKYCLLMTHEIICASGLPLTCPAYTPPPPQQFESIFGYQDIVGSFRVVPM